MEESLVDGERWRTRMGEIGFDEVLVATCSRPELEGLEPRRARAKQGNAPAQAMLDLIESESASVSMIVFGQSERTWRRCWRIRRSWSAPIRWGSRAGPGPHPGKPHPRMYGPSRASSACMPARRTVLHGDRGPQDDGWPPPSWAPRSRLLRPGYFADVASSIRPRCGTRRRSRIPTAIRRASPTFVVNGRLAIDAGRMTARATAESSDTRSRQRDRGEGGAWTSDRRRPRAVALLLGGDRRSGRSAGSRCGVSGTATLLSLLIGVPIGAGLALTRFRGRAVLVTAVNTGMGLPPVVVGLFASILLWRSGALGALELLYTPSALILAQAAIASPIVAGITLAAVQSIPERFRLQLYGLGASRLQMVRVVLREARLPMLAAVMAGFGGVISEVAPSLMFGGNIRGHTRTLTTAMVLETNRGNFEVAIALALLLLLLMFAVNWVLTRVQQR